MKKKLWKDKTRRIKKRKNGKTEKVRRKYEIGNRQKERKTERIKTKMIV